LTKTCQKLVKNLSTNFVALGRTQKKVKKSGEEEELEEEEEEDWHSLDQVPTSSHLVKNMKKNKHNFYSKVVNKLMSLSSPMLCGSHFLPIFSHLSVGTMQWPQAKRAATCQANW
jgi:hypothetical protein